MKQPEIVTPENLLVILDDYDMFQSFYHELKKTDDVSRAVWYTLRNRDTNRALKALENKEQDPHT